jgi:hypothetical protein
MNPSYFPTQSYQCNRGIYGGGIDILTRTGTGGINTYLCIMELKDENVKSEPPKDALKQAIAYTSFIRELLRSEAGQEWWTLFGFNGKIPKQLTLYAACVMPSSNCNDYSFRDMTLDIDGDTIKLHYVYFIEKNNKITEVDTSLQLYMKNIYLSIYLFIYLYKNKNAAN